MRRGPIPLSAHAALEPLIAIVAAPWIFGFSDVDDAKAVCIAVGAIMLIAGVLEILTALATRWDPVEAEESAVDRRSRSTPAH